MFQYLNCNALLFRNGLISKTQITAISCTATHKKLFFSFSHKRPAGSIKGQ